VSIAVDIELLLHWAYRDELSKRATSSAEGVWQHVREIGQLGGIEISSSGPQRYDLGTPHPDALRLEQAVALLPDAPLDWRELATDVLGDLLALVDPGSKKNEPVSLGSALPHTLARWRTRNGRSISVTLEPPRQVILVRSLRTAALVTRHAVMETRPDWIVEVPKPHHVRSNKGPHPAIVGECKGRNYYSTGSYCPITWEPSVISIAEARADYLAWWRGLQQLTTNLRLERFRSTGPAAPEMPWKHYKPQHVRMHVKPAAGFSQSAGVLR
jgi:hypothetical protein